MSLASLTLILLAAPSVVAESPAAKLPGATPVAPAASPEVLDDPPPTEETLVGPEPAGLEPPPEQYHWEKASAAWDRPSRPIRWRLDPFISFGTMRVAPKAYRALDDGPNQFQLAVGLRLDARVRGPLFLGGGLQYMRASGSAAPYDGALTTDYVGHAAIASLRASFVLVEGLDVVTALEGGPQVVRTSVDSNDRSTDTTRVLGAFAAKAGVSVYLPKAWHPRRGAARFTGGIDLMMGYGVGTQLRLAPRPDVASDAIDTRGTSLGTVRMHGYVWSLGVFVRFM